jgi:lysophospholipase L1-like esterase
MTKRSILSVSFLLVNICAFSQSFSFSKALKADHYITKADAYTDENKFGFDFDSATKAHLDKTGFTATGSVYFSVAVPEGNYRVDVMLGSPKMASTTTIKGESRVLFVEQFPVKKKASATVSFNVNIRSRKIAGSTDEVELKDRDLKDLDWDNKLTLEFLGNSAVQEIKITPVANLTTIYLAGDSTVTNQGEEPWASWGQFLPNYVNQNTAVANYAFSGASLQSFKGMHRLEKILSVIKKGDYLLIEFGHNDEKIKGEGNGAYGLYANTLKEFIALGREKGANVILLTPTQRRRFTDGKLEETHGDFPDAMRKVAAELNVPLIDITKLTTTMYESWGDDKSRNALVHYPANTFPNQTKALEDNTHFNSFGASEIALAVINDIKNQNLPLKKLLKENTPAYDTAKPNDISAFTLPMSQRFDTAKPKGN